MHKKQFLQLLRISVSAGLLIFLFSMVELDDLAEQARDIHVPWLVLHVGLAFFAILISSWKWKMLCNATGIRTPFLKLLGLYLVGTFYNHFLPTSVGGDVVRGYELARGDCPLADAYASIFVERYIGLATLLLIVLVALPFDVRFYGDFRILLLAGMLTAGFVLGSWVIFSPALVLHLETRWHGSMMRKLLKKVRSFQTALTRYHKKGGSLAAAFAVSLLFYANAVFTIQTGLLALGVEVSLSQLFIAVPVMLMLFLLPISLGGIGLQEWAHAFVLGILGVPVLVGVSLGLLFRLRSILFGLIGGLIILMRCFEGLRMPHEAGKIDSLTEDVGR